jgi:hypothetical protein
MLLLAGPLAIIAAAVGATFGALAVISPRGLVKLISDRTVWRNGMFIVIISPASIPVTLLRTVGRALGAFGAARLMLLAFGLGPAHVVAIAVALLLTAWDFHRLLFLYRMSFRPPAGTVQLQRTQIVLGLFVSVLAAFLFIET